MLWEMLDFTNKRIQIRYKASMRYLWSLKRVECGFSSLSIWEEFQFDIAVEQVIEKVRTRTWERDLACKKWKWSGREAWGQTALNMGFFLYIGHIEATLGAFTVGVLYGFSLGLRQILEECVVLFSFISHGSETLMICEINLWMWISNPSPRVCIICTTMVHLVSSSWKAFNGRIIRSWLGTISCSFRKMGILDSKLSRHVSSCTLWGFLRIPLLSISKLAHFNVHLINYSFHLSKEM